DGFALYAQLHRSCAAPPAAVLMVTSADRGGTSRLPPGLPRIPQVSKPAKPAELRRAIGQGLGSSDAPESHGAIEREGEASAPRARGVRALRILLVDDNPFNQKVASLKLEKMGHAVRIVGGGAAALAAADEAFDLIFTDLEMPGMNGYELTAAI